jgi:5-methylcytosine-specific restriction enzyme MrcB-like protein
MPPVTPATAGWRSKADNKTSREAAGTWSRWRAARLGSLPESFELSEISLKVPSNSLGAFYEAGNICTAFYSAEALAEADKLTQDLQACSKGPACEIDAV